MKIEIKNLKVSERFSEETLLFSADIFINGIKAARAHNDGQGGCTSYHGIFEVKGTTTEQIKGLIKDAEEWAASLPPIKVKIEGVTPFEYKMNLEHYIDNAVYEKTQEKRFAKDFSKGVCFGTKEKYQVRWYTGHTIEKLLATEKGTAALIKLVKDVRANLAEGESILNTNIPELVLNQITVPVV